VEAATLEEQMAALLADVDMSSATESDAVDSGDVDT
jgi:hypothetical protein